MALKIAILASGNGSNAQAIIDKVNAGILDVSINLIFSNRPDAYVLERAKKADLPSAMLDHRSFPDRKSYDLAIAELIKQHDCELVVLAGYMRILSSSFLEIFKGRVINVHPAILPSFPGTHGVRDALDYGVKITGVSAHFVEEQMDSGPIIIQAALSILQNETEEELLAKIHQLEHRIYPQALQWLAEKRLQLHDDRHVALLPGKRKQLKPEGAFIVSPPLEEGF